MNKNIEGKVTKIYPICYDPESKTGIIPIKFELLKDNGQTEDIEFPMQVDLVGIINQRVRYVEDTHGYMGGRTEDILEILEGPLKGVSYHHNPYHNPFD